jgi:8-oxo-dGTP pyrophosphatase MutT (NUDIX family)
MFSVSSGEDAAEDDQFTDVVNKHALKRKTIDSFAIICYTIIDGQINYLLARVRDTIPFREFIRGNIKDSDMIRYISQMAQEEKYRILTEPFQELVDDIIINHSSRSYKKTREAGDVFETNRQLYRKQFLDPSIGLPEAPHIFPGGRKTILETEQECALREFEEETRIPRHLIHLVSDTFEPLEEIYTGLDGSMYRKVYFIGYINYEDFKQVGPHMRTKFVITNKRTSLSDEISKIRWMEYPDAINNLDAAKQYVLRLANTFLIFRLERNEVSRRHSI